jgi:hypothetical protein
MQALCVVSPEWVKAVGDLHDPDNPRNRALFDQAKAWAESWAGKGAVFGARLDLDEAGGAVVDLMISPVRTSRGKPVISTQKALVEQMGVRPERVCLIENGVDTRRFSPGPDDTAFRAKFGLGQQRLQFAQQPDNVMIGLVAGRFLRLRQQILQPADGLRRVVRHAAGGQLLQKAGV